MLLTKCLYCDDLTASRSNELSVCTKCKQGTQQTEAERWAGLSVEQKLDELKARLDAMDGRLSPLDLIG